MDQRIQIVRSAIEQECRRAWAITALARLVNLSPSRLRHLFKTETGITPNQFLKEVRLAEAETAAAHDILTCERDHEPRGIFG